MERNKNRPKSSCNVKMRPVSGISFQSGIGFSHALKSHNYNTVGNRQLTEEKNMKQINNLLGSDGGLPQVKREKEKTQLNSQRLIGQIQNYRIALPIGKQEDVSSKFWEVSNEQLKKPNGNNQMSQPINDNKSNYQFLGQLGGKQTCLMDITQQKIGDFDQFKPKIQDKQQVKAINVESLSSFSKLDIDRNIKSQMKSKNKQILMTQQQQNQQSRTMTGKYVGQTVDKSSNTLLSRPMTGQQQQVKVIKQSNRPMTAVIKNPQNIRQSERVKSNKIVQYKTDHNENNQQQTNNLINNYVDLDIKEDLDESNEEVYRQIDNAKSIKNNRRIHSNNNNRIQSGLLSMRPISGKQYNMDSQQYFQQFNKMTQFTQKEMPYEELFDRNERTIAATFVKFNDLSYHSPVQRIGSYYQYIAKLKQSQILEVIDIQKSINHPEKNKCEISIQLKIVNEIEINKGIDKVKASNTIFTDEDINRVPITLTLFPEYFGQNDDEEYTQTQLAQMLFNKMMDEMNGQYDPQYLCRSNYIYIEQQYWPQDIKQLVQQSLHRYNYYIQSDIIKNQDISQYNKQWLTNSFKLIDQDILMKYQISSKALIKQIIHNYKLSMKQSMLDYILLSPLERERLNIVLIPRPIITSNKRICREGGYSIQLYPEWHYNYQKSYDFLNLNLTQSNIIISSLQNWFQDFEHLELFEIDTFEMMRQMNYSISFPNFIKIQSNYINKVIQIFRSIWLRGALLIIRKFKYMRTKDNQNNRFTLNGYQKMVQNLQYKLKYFAYKFHNYSFQQQIKNVQLDDDSDIDNNQIEYYIYNVLFEQRQIDSDLDKPFNNINHVHYNNLQDIRDTWAFYYSLKRQNIQHSFKQILKENGWSQINSKNKMKILKCSEVLMGKQLKSIIQKTFNRINDYIFSFDRFSVITQNYAKQKESAEEKEKWFEIINLQQKKITEQTEKVFNFSQTLNSKTEFSLPQFEFTKNERYNNKPFIQLNVLFDDQGCSLYIQETEQYVSKKLNDLMNDIMEGFNQFQHPKNLKVVHQQKLIERGKSIRPDNVEEMKNFFLEENHEQMYKGYMKIVRLKQKKPKENNLQQSFMEKKEDQANQQKIQYIRVIQQNDKYYSQQVQNIVQYMMKHYQECHMVFRLFDQFKPFIEKTIQQNIQEMLKGDEMTKSRVSQSDYKNMIELMIRFKSLLEQIPDFIYFPIFSINLIQVKQKLDNNINQQQIVILQHLEDDINQQIEYLNNQYTQIVNTINQSVTKAEEVETMDKYKYDLTNKKVLLKQKSNDVFMKMSFLLKLDRQIQLPNDKVSLGQNQKGQLNTQFIQNQNTSQQNQQQQENNIYQWPQEIFNIAQELYEWPDNLEKKFIKADQYHQLQKQELEEKLKKDIQAFKNRLEVYEDELKIIESNSEFSKYKQYNEQMNKLDQQLKNLKDEMMDIQDQENKLLGYSNNYDIYYKLEDTLKPNKQLWHSIDQFIDFKKEWQSQAVQTLDSQLIEEETKKGLRQAITLAQQIDKNSLVYQVVTQFKEETNQILQKIQLIEILSNKGVKERHYDQINQLLDQEVFFNTNNYKEIILTNIEVVQSELEVISQQASKEYKLEQMIVKMQNEWKNVCWKVISYKDIYNILQGQCVEDVQSILDDQIYKAQTIRCSPNIKFMMDQAIQWENLLLYIDEVTDLLINVQINYQNLYPIFQYDDIKKNLQKQASQFCQVQQIFDKVISSLQQNNKIIEIMTINNLKQDLEFALKNIESIQKGVEIHLEKKRIDFPRFFFLSNEDLLSILAEPKDPQKVQNHIKKLFEGIQCLNFQGGFEIEGMTSSEDESVKFINKISIDSNGKKAVESWLKKIEIQMKTTICKSIDDSYIEIKNNLQQLNQFFLEWIFKYPGQVIQLVSQILFVQQVEQGIEGNQIKQFQKEQVELMQDIVGLVRQKQEKLHSTTIGVLIINIVHNNDLVDKLVEIEQLNINDFNWQIQMRFYYSQLDQQQLQQVQQNTTIFNTSNVLCRMMQTKQEYGYEYLGNQSRLVITELTNRCFRTLMQALELNLGGAPEGPAGTGKTETVKDLSKVLAQQCQVTNCSEGLQTHNMAKFFKGLACSGAWSCFDEFNRIDVEVLSVVAQQILQIQQAKTKQLKVFDFEGTSNLILKYSCNIFITMNPGYGGRNELPENLKVLFRPVAMMVAQYRVIAEISLYSFGFIDARNLANKIVTTYNLCSEQLSNQKHYDYGMRAVKSVLNSVQNIKNKFKDANEQQLVLKSIIDINLPKFVDQDIQLFNGIIKDIFPNVEFIESQNEQLSVNIDNVIDSWKLQNSCDLKNKIYQLQEMINVRHGLMIVGNAFTGKSKLYQILEKAQNMIEVNRVNHYVINPKSITISQIYGYSDIISKEWTDGILCEVFRKCTQQPIDQQQLIIFDGPVTPDWIENMNTVLDDNKKLCLMNGESIQMTNYMSMLFEVDELTQASPATISRCGMVYMQDQIITHSFIISSFLQKNTIINLDSEIVQHLHELFDALLRKVFYFMKTKTKQYQSLCNNHLVQQLLTMYEGLLKQHSLLDSKYINKYLHSHNDSRIEDLFIRYDILFLESIKWSLGATSIQNHRDTFSLFFKQLTTDQLRCESYKDKQFKLDKSIQIQHTKQNNCFDYLVSEDYRWKLVKDQMQQHISPEQMNQIGNNQIIIETTESVVLKQLLKLSIDHDYSLLLIGLSGTGKTLYTKQFINQLVYKEQDDDKPSQMYNVVNIQFSAQTMSKNTQIQIMNRLERRRKGVHGPKIGYKAVILVDDMNMCKSDSSGNQSSIELLRQLRDQNGFYSLEDRKLIEVIDYNLLGLMGVPGGGRKMITNRFIRHFHYVNINENNTMNLFNIFNSILKTQLNQNYNKILSNIVESIIYVYQEIQKELKPTPSKPQYIFNLRDMNRIIQGMSQFNIKCQDDQDYQHDLVRLAIHEMNRCFYDRLIESKDKKVYYSIVQSSVRHKIKDDFKNIIKKSHPQFMNMSKYEFETNVDVLENILFNDIHSEQINPDDKIYKEIIGYQTVSTKLNQYLEDYNSLSKKPMNLVLFNYVIYQLLKLTRALKLSQGHVIFVGLGGTGRNSLSRLAIYLRDYQYYQLEVNQNYNQDNWRTTLQEILSKAGLEMKKSCLIIQENQIKQQYQFILEDINSLINTGDVPNIFSQEEFIPMIDKLRENISKQFQQVKLDTLSNEQVYDYFINCINQNLHLIITINPLADELRNKIINYPSLVSCTNMIWFNNWPLEGLVAVATSKLEKVEELDKKQTQLTVSISKTIYSSIQQLAQTYQLSEKRKVYVTPAIYLEYIQIFREILGISKKNLESEINKYRNGSEKLESTRTNIQNMEKELIEKQPELIKFKEETQVMSEKIKEQVDYMQPIKQKVEQEEAIVQQKYREAQEIKDECEHDLSQAKPILKKAEDALLKVEISDLIALRAMLKPPEVLTMVMEVCCILLDEDPIMIPTPGNPKQKQASYWETSKLQLKDSKHFLSRLLKYDKDNIRDDLIMKVRDKYLSNTKIFNQQRVKSASESVLGIFQWIIALDGYYKVYKEVQPKLRKLDAVNLKLAELEKNLKAKMEELDKLNKQINELKVKYDETMLQQQKLEQEISDCRLKLQRANQLIDGLSGEKQRWIDQSEQLSQKQKYLFGDILIATAVIIYLGPFTKSYRYQVMKEWMDQCKKSSIQYSNDFLLQNVVGDPVTILQWNIKGLPKDQYSIENGLIYQQNKRYPLFIDPQQQANKWIKQKEIENQIEIVKQTDSDFMKKLETCLQFGYPLLIQNLGNNIMSILDPLLARQFYKQGGSTMIKLGDNSIEYNTDFRLYMSTKLNNPEYSPELFTKVNIINFMLTQFALEDQLLELAISKDEPDWDEKNQRLVVEDYENNKQLMNIENQILKVLQNCENILGDEQACNILNNSKILAQEIEEKQQQSQITKQKIKDIKVNYQQIAKQGSVLFEVLQSLQHLDQMYQFSLDYFINYYITCFDKAVQSNYIQERIESIFGTMTQLFYTQICQGLFQQHILIFVFILLIKLSLSNQQLDIQEYNYFMQGDISGHSSRRNDPIQLPNELIGLLNEPALNRLTGLSNLVPSFKSIIDHLLSNPIFYREYMLSNCAHTLQVPQPFDQMTSIQRLCLLKCLRPDKILECIKDYISNSDILGSEYLNPPTFNIKQSYNQSLNNYPVLFLLPGNDPVQVLLSFANQKGKHLTLISLGQGQGQLAQQSIQNAIDTGDWVLLLNCHLYPSWMQKLEDIIENLDTKKNSLHPSFRLFLTSFSSDVVPISVLQNCIKVTNESPQGFKFNLQSSLNCQVLQDKNYFNHPNYKEVSKYVFSLIMFHAVVTQRKSFKSLGWNIQYEFNLSDLEISLQQVQNLLLTSKADETFLKTIKYLVGECNYGGRVTDDKDRKVMNALLNDFITLDVLNTDFKLQGVSLDNFELVGQGSPNQQLNQIDQLISGIENNPSSELYGLHPNAEITKNINEGRSIIDNVINCIQIETTKTKQEGTESQSEIQVKQISQQIMQQIHKKFDILIAQAKYPLNYRNSMNTVLIQECNRFNNLTITIHSTLAQIEQAMEGTITLTREIEQICESLLIGRIPNYWLKHSYLSIKSLADYIIDLERRIQYFQDWIDKREPNVHWISGYFFTQSFLTAILQNYARKYKKPIDSIDFDFEYLAPLPNDNLQQDRIDSGYFQPELGDGNLIHGLFLEGAAWNHDEQIIIESEYKVLLTNAPVIYLRPLPKSDIQLDSSKYYYQCPVYKTTERRGELLSTGHNSNFLISIRLPSLQPSSLWIKRSLAMFSQKND